MTDAAALARSIVARYEHDGHERYDEVVTQTDHALQTLGCALVDGAPPHLSVAAFLHDVGHLLVDESDEVDRRHERVGAAWLSRWFGEHVAEPVADHVDAKRWLCAVEPEYHAALSSASVHSLALQGGPMSADEVAEFEARRGADEAVRLRRWDDLAKVPGAAAPSLAEAEALLREVLAAR